MKHPEKLKELQGQQRNLLAQVAQIEKTLDDHKLRLSDVSVAEEQLAELKRHREDLEAEAALGHDVSNRLDKVIKEIEVAAKCVADYDQLKATISGLDRKLYEAKQAFQSTYAATIPAKVAMLMEEAEALGGEYLSAASKTVALLRRLVALDSFLAPLGYPIAYSNWKETSGLPAFRLQCHEGAKRNLADESQLDIASELKHYYHPSGAYQADIDAEISRLKAVGIDLQQ